MSAIKIKNLSKSFEDFSLNIKELDIKEGYVTGFIGPNGSGKTNLFVGFNKLRKIIVMSTVIGVRSRKLLEVPIVKKELTSPIENFKFDKNSSSRPTEFGIDIIIDDILYTYDLKC